MKIENRKRKHKKLITIVVTILVLFCIWSVLRITSSLPFDTTREVLATTYTEDDQVMKAISLSYFIYGCETETGLSGSISNILDQKNMGILIENFGINRTDVDDPKTALFDTSDFIRRYVGDYRFLTELRDEKSGFYGAAFCDDINKCVWITYSGSVTITDSIACAEIVLMPGFSNQEKLAFDLMNTVLNSNEVKNQAYQIILSGHSLGGILATEVSLSSRCKAITISGADGIAIDKMNAIAGKKLEAKQISNYMTIPKKEKKEFRDWVQQLMFLGSYKAVDYHLYPDNGLTSDSHCVFSFLTFPGDDFTKPIVPYSYD